jgi:hypothetical protein
MVLRRNPKRGITLVHVQKPKLITYYELYRMNSRTFYGPKKDGRPKQKVKWWKAATGDLLPADPLQGGQAIIKDCISIKTHVAQV